MVCRRRRCRCGAGSSPCCGRPDRNDSAHPPADDDESAPRHDDGAASGDDYDSPEHAVHDFVPATHDHDAERADHPGTGRHDDSATHNIDRPRRRPGIHLDVGEPGRRATEYPTDVGGSDGTVRDVCASRRRS